MLITTTEIWTDVLDFLGQAWWVEVLTDRPKCIYYFGPFARAEDADVSIAGYVEELQSEFAQGI